jgi:hypothetical protein
VELDAFTSRLGLGQGRLPASSGTFEFVLGDAELGRWATLVLGDRVGLTQQANLTDVDLVRVQATLRVPASLPPTLAWEASIVVDGVKAARTSCAAGRTRRLTDLAANVSRLSGMHTVEVRLELVAA